MFDLGEQLKNLRKDKGYTQPQVAHKLNKSVTTISRYEKNVQTPPIDVLIEMAFLYNVSIDTIIGNKKYRAVLTDGLTEKQIEILQLLIYEWKDKTAVYHADGLTPRQQEIIARLMNEFAKKK